ncbi:hypothetical protein C2845_PM15G17390 [Panicum miliaceum]|uniref:BHLH domain-containing protein n=1 Tax=Panicum miliaceum TaxID=4540 RepID=A0A3L6Q4A7_PANMI|nr:hypothetical protein C2845_PM15G17390 [Panicum miliaceum]
MCYRQVPENTELVNQITTFFKDLQYPACMYVPSTNVTGQAENVIVLLDDLDENATAMISEDRHEFGEIDHLFNTNTNLEQITEIEDFYGLWEELDVQPLESSWVMDGPSMVAAPEAAKHAATQSAPTESSRMTSFVAWMTPSSGELAALAVPIIGEPQNLLKKVVTGGAWMNNGDERTGRRIAKESGIKNHVKSERRRREKLNEMLLILKSLIPTIRKMDKASILAETIAYLKQLEQKVQELESSRGAISSPAGETMLRCHDNEIGKRVSAAKKRKKASKLSGNMEEEHHWVLSEDSASNVIIVSIIGARVIVQVQCRWKELLMARVFETIKNLDLDILSVQASTPDGLLGLKIQAQFVGSATFAPGMIRESLQKAIGKS